MKRILLVALLFAFFVCSVFAQAVSETAQVNEVRKVTDDCGRVVEIPAEITKVSPTGAVATMFLSVISPDCMTNIEITPNAIQMQYLPKELGSLPATGSFFGAKANFNVEELIATGSQIIIDVGDYKAGLENDLDSLQQQTGIPCIHFEGSLDSMASTFRKLGSLISGKSQRGEDLAAYVEKTQAMVKENSAKVKSDEVVRIMYTTGNDGLGTNAKGSFHAQAIELVGAENAIVLEKVSNKGGGNQINMEMLFNFNPDVIIFADDSIYTTVEKDPSWKELDAIKNGRFYEMPCQPYYWLSNPPSINMLLGLWWLGNLVYPQYYDYDVASIAKEYYKLFWNCELTDSQVTEMLSRSTLK